MPSPIAHLAVGYTIYRQYKDRLPQDQRSIGKLPIQPATVAALSILPDLDVIPAIIFRDMQGYHNNFSHSFLVGIPVAMLVAGLFHGAYRSNYWVWFAICLLSYDLHVIMDALTAERGVMMFWPITQVRFASPIKLFYGLQWGLGWFSIWHLWTIFTEFLFSLTVIVATNFFNKRRNHQTDILSRRD